MGPNEEDFLASYDPAAYPRFAGAWARVPTRAAPSAWR